MREAAPTARSRREEADAGRECAGEGNCFPAMAVTGEQCDSLEVGSRWSAVCD